MAFACALFLLIMFILPTAATTYRVPASIYDVAPPTSSGSVSSLADGWSGQTVADVASLTFSRMEYGRPYVFTFFITDMVIPSYNEWSYVSFQVEPTGTGGMPGHYSTGFFDNSSGVYSGNHAGISYRQGNDINGLQDFPNEWILPDAFTNIALTITFIRYSNGGVAGASSVQMAMDLHFYDMTDTAISLVKHVTYSTMITGAASGVTLSIKAQSQNPLTDVSVGYDFYDHLHPTPHGAEAIVALALQQRTSFSDGYDEGYDKAKKEWYTTGYDDGAWDKYREAVDGYLAAGGTNEYLRSEDGFTPIFDHFKDVGWTQAVDQGSLTARLIFTVLEAPINVILGGLDFTVFGVNLAQTMFAILSVIIVYAILTVVLKVLSIVT